MLLNDISKKSLISFVKEINLYHQFRIILGTKYPFCAISAIKPGSTNQPCSISFALVVMWWNILQLTDNVKLGTWFSIGSTSYFNCISW